jgi:hypothetical protein
MTPRSTFLLDVIRWHPSYPLKHHFPQVSLVESVTAVQPGLSDPNQTDPAAPPGVPVSYRPPWAHYLDGSQDRLLGGPLGLPGLRYMAPEGVEHKDCRGEVLS